MKPICFYITMSLIITTPSSFAAETPAAPARCILEKINSVCATETLNLFVGPQSVEPGKPIYIAVETVNFEGGSGDSAEIIIVDTHSGREYRAAVENGLAHLQLNAPSQAGRLTFVARDKDIVSSKAEVLVYAAGPADFKLNLEKEKNQVFISSSILADKFGNMIEDGQAANIVLSNGTNISQTFTAQTHAGRLSFRIKCSDIPRTGAVLHAKLRAAGAEINIPSYMCEGRS